LSPLVKAYKAIQMIYSRSSDNEYANLLESD